VPGNNRCGDNLDCLRLQRLALQYDDLPRRGAFLCGEAGEDAVHGTSHQNAPSRGCMLRATAALTTSMPDEEFDNGSTSSGSESPQVRR